MSGSSSSPSQSRVRLAPVWTRRQREVLDLLVRGRTNPEIATALGISLDGAKWHVSEVITKLGVDSRDEAAEYWRAHTGLRLRFTRILHALIASTWLKVGGGVAVVAGASAAVAIAIIALNDSGTSPVGTVPTPGARGGTLSFVVDDLPGENASEIHANNIYGVIPGAPSFQMTSTQSRKSGLEWAPNGSRLAFTAEPAIVRGSPQGKQSVGVVNVDGTGEKVLATTANLGSENPLFERLAWTLSGDGILFTSDGQGLDEVDLASSTVQHRVSGCIAPQSVRTTTLVACLAARNVNGATMTGPVLLYETKGASWSQVRPVTDSDGAGWFEISPNGRDIAWVTQDRAPRLFVGGLDASSHANEIPAAGATLLGWSPDGSRLLYSAYDSTKDCNSLFVYDPLTASSHNLTPGPGCHYEGAWSPDGALIAYTQGDPSEVYLMDSDGTNVRPLVLNGQTCSRLTWSDGQ